jgi:hypothetical protein
MPIPNFLQYIEPVECPKERIERILFIDAAKEAINAVPKEKRKKYYYPIVDTSGLGFTILGKN